MQIVIYCGIKSTSEASARMAVINDTQIMKWIVIFKTNDSFIFV